MNTYFKNILALLFAVISMFSCREETKPYEVQTDDTTLPRIYIAKAVNTQILNVLPYSNTKTTTFNAGYGGLGLPANNIEVKFAVDTKALDSINAGRLAAGQTKYELFPADSYSLDKLNATIPAGKIESEMVTLTFKPKAFDVNKEYILPISIVSAGNYKLSNAKTVVFTVPKLDKFKMLARNGWTASADSEQASGENTGKANAVLDGDLNTIWHTSYSPTQPPYPHWLNIDMKAPYYVGKIEMAPRQNNPNGPTKFYVEGSKDGKTWTKMLEETTFDPAKTSFQSFELTSPGEVQYLKVTFTQGKATWSFLSEMRVYEILQEFR